MKINKRLMRLLFDELNAQLFDNKLPRIKFKLLTDGTDGGYCSASKIEHGVIVAYRHCWIGIGNHLDLNIDWYRRIMIHEMVHYEFGCLGITDPATHELFQGHGRDFHLRHWECLRQLRLVPHDYGEYSDKRQTLKAPMHLLIAETLSGKRTFYMRVTPEIYHGVARTRDFQRMFLNQVSAHCGTVRFALSSDTLLASAPYTISNTLQIFALTDGQYELDEPA